MDYVGQETHNQYLESAHYEDLNGAVEDVPAAIPYENQDVKCGNPKENRNGDANPKWIKEKHTPDNRQKKVLGVFYRMEFRATGSGVIIDIHVVHDEIT